MADFTTLLARIGANAASILSLSAVSTALLNLAGLNTPLTSLAGNVSPLTDLSGASTAILNAAALFQGRRLNGNGDQLIDQRHQGASVSISNTKAYITDRYFVVSTPAVTAQQVNSSLAGFAKSLKVTITAGTAPGTTNYTLLATTIEGFDCAKLLWGTANAKPINISFRAKAPVTGNYSIALRNGTSTRTYIASFALVANTDTPVSLAIPGDTSGAWITDNGPGLSISFDLGAGTTYSTTAGSWQAGNYFGLTGGVKLATTTGNTFEMTGLQIEQGTQRTEYEYLPYATEIYRAWRYCYVWRSTGAYDIVCPAVQLNNATSVGYLKFPTTLRANPTFSQPTGSIGFFQWVGNGSSNQNAAVTMNGSGYGASESVNGAILSCASSGVTASIQGTLGSYNSIGATMVFDADY